MPQKTDHRLVRSKRNEVFKAAVERGLNPADFKWIDSNAHARSMSTISILKFRPADPDNLFFSFDIAGEGTNLLWRMSPGLNLRLEQGYTATWAGQLAHACTWLDFIQKEAEPDMWAMIESEKSLALAASEPESDEKPFTAAEQLRITENLSEIKNYLVATVELGNEQRAFVEDRFEYLADASTRLGRKDWLTVLYGGLINIVVGLALRGDNASELLRFAGQVFHWLVKTQYLFPVSGA